MGLSHNQSDYHNAQGLDLAPFTRFQGRRLIVLVICFIAYTLWYVGPGPFGQLADLAPGMPIQQKGFYTGQEAVNILSTLDDRGRRIKYLALALDVPYMILQALIFEAFIAFGFLRLSARYATFRSPKWRWLFVLPIAFVLVDALEDSLIALTVATGSVGIGTVAGMGTLLKFIIFIPTSLIALVFFGAGLIMGRRKASQ